MPARAAAHVACAIFEWSCSALTLLTPNPLHRWVFVYEKGYQTSSGLISSVSVKLKGLAVTQLPGLGPQVWDVADYVFPAQVSYTFHPDDLAQSRIGLSPTADGTSPAPIPLWASASLTSKSKWLHHPTLPSWAGKAAGYPVDSRGLLGQCLGSGGCSQLRALVSPSPAPHFQGDSSFVIMTNFIATPRQVQGYCAEVRTATHPPSLLLGPRAEEKVPLRVEDRIPEGTIMVEF